MRSVAYDYPIGSNNNSKFDKRLYDPVSALVAGGLMFGQMAMQDRAQKKARRAQQNAEMDARRIAAEKKPLEESATLTSPVDDPTKMLSKLNLLVEPQQRGKSAVGFGSMTQSKLGFGG